MLQLGPTTDTEFDGLATRKFNVESTMIVLTVEISLNTDLKQINRKTDSFFDWLGDWGGLQDGLTFLVDIVVNPV